ncbi:MAG: hypothetical protein NZO58_01310 [Gemmataceae bacterium]|nr:hypothetical protein [Gemmataceae bacterium]
MDDCIDNSSPTASLDAPALGELERRVGALEETVARLQHDTEALEDRLLARLTERQPSAATAVEPPTNQATAPCFDGGARAGRDSAWLVVVMFDDAKTLVRMVRDRHYYWAWSTRLLVLVLVPAILTTHWWLPLAWLPAFGGFCVNVVNLALAFVLYRALSRETRRYRNLRW